MQVTREAFFKNLVSTVYYYLNGSYNVLAANIDHDYTWQNQQGTILYAFGVYQNIPFGVWCAANPILNKTSKILLSLICFVVVTLIPAMRQAAVQDHQIAPSIDYAPSVRVERQSLLPCIEPPKVSLCTLRH